MPAPVAALATFLLCAFISLLPAAAGWLQARIPAHAAVRACLLIPASWTLFEWIRSWILSGFPWLSFGYAGVGWPLQGYAPLGGVFLVSFLTMGLGGMIWLLATRAPRPLPGQSHSSPSSPEAKYCAPFNGAPPRGRPSAQHSCR